MRWTITPKRSTAPLLKRLAQEKADRVDTQDGVKLDFREGWVHIRPSNTEPIVRVYAEAKTAAEADKLANRYKELVASFIAGTGK